MIKDCEDMCLLVRRQGACFRLSRQEAYLLFRGICLPGVERPQQTPGVSVVEENCQTLPDDCFGVCIPQLLRQRQLVLVEAFISFLSAASTDKSAPRD